MARWPAAPAQELVLRHRDGLLAARFWLDTQTKLPLRRETYDDSARMVSQDVFVEPQARLGLPLRPLPAARRCQGARRCPASSWPVCGPLAGRFPRSCPASSAWFEASETRGPAGSVMDLAYSDGLSVISLFVQRGHLPAQLNGWSRVAIRGDPVYEAAPDQRSVGLVRPGLRVHADR